MIPHRSRHFAQAVSDLQSAAVALADVAVELNGIATGLETEKVDLLRLQSVGVQTESARAALAVLTARGVASQLATIARIDEDQEALDDE